VKTGDRLDIIVNERGASTSARDIRQLADAAAKLSPALARSLRGHALRIGISTDALVKDVAVAALETVVRATPVDTGRARRNWQTAVRVSRSISVPIEEFDKSGEATIAEGTAIIRGSERPDGHSIIISNSLKYIQALNSGHSKQAAAGFVERAVQSARNTVSNANLLGKK
jgi:hypothetical protein